MNQHKLIRDQLVQWTLGEPLDMPLAALLDHLCHCASCREFARNVEETLAELPSVLPFQQPPPGLRSAVLQAVRTLDAPELVTDDGPEEMAHIPGEVGRHPSVRGLFQGESQRERHGQLRPKGRLHNLRPGWRQTLLQPMVTGLAVACMVFGLGSGALFHNLRTKEQQLAALTSRYEEETRWLEVATHILAEQTAPDLQVPLAPTEHEPQAFGQAVLYYAYGDTYYLLVHVQGLTPQAEYEIWLQTGDDRVQIGALTTSDEGEEVWVYRSTEGMIAGRLGVRRVGAPGPSVVVDL